MKKADEILQAISILEEDCRYVPEICFIISTITHFYFIDRAGFFGHSMDKYTKQIEMLCDYKEIEWLLNRYVPSHDRELLQGLVPVD